MLAALLLIPLAAIIVTAEQPYIRYNSGMCLLYLLISKTQFAICIHRMSVTVEQHAHLLLFRWLCQSSEPGNHTVVRSLLSRCIQRYDGGQ